MPVTEQVQAIGSWSLRLRPETPLSVTDQVAAATFGFSHVIVTPAPIDARLVSATTLLNWSLWTGVLMRQDERVALAGSGPAMWMGGENGDGDWNWTFSTTTANLNSAVDSLRITYNALGIGSVPYLSFTSVSTVVATRTFNSAGGGTLRERADLVARHYGVEWRATPALTVRFGTIADLYSLTPRAILSPDGQGVDGAWRSMPATLAASVHLEDYATAIGAQNSTNTTYSTITPPYRDVNGNLVRRTRRVSVPETITSELGNVAASIHVAVDQPAYQVTADVDEFAVTEFVPVGSYVYLWDPNQGIVDAATRIQFRGQTINPVAVRVVGATWPIRRGMGVYMRQSTTGAAVIDLTDWVEWESGDARLELGDPFPMLTQTFQSTPRTI